MIRGSQPITSRTDSPMSPGRPAWNGSSPGICTRLFRREPNCGLMAGTTRLPVRPLPRHLRISRSALRGRWCCFWPTPPEEKLEISTHDLYFLEQTLHFSYSCGPNDTREALSWIHRGAVRAEEHVTHRFPFEQTSEAFRVTREAGHSIKAIVLVDESQT